MGSVIRLKFPLTVRAQIVKTPEQYEFTSWADILRFNTTGNRLKRNIIFCFRKFNSGLEKLSSKLVFEMYAERLKLVCRAMLELGGLAKLDRGVVDELFQRQKFWSSSYFVGSG